MFGADRRTCDPCQSSRRKHFCPTARPSVTHARFLRLRALLCRTACGAQSSGATFACVFCRRPRSPGHGDCRNVRKDSHYRQGCSSSHMADRVKMVSPSLFAVVPPNHKETCWPNIRFTPLPGERCCFAFRCCVLPELSVALRAPPMAAPVGVVMATDSVSLFQRHSTRGAV